MPPLKLKALGRYKVRGVLGRGNMGVVYRGHDPIIDRPVAIKTVALPKTLSEAERDAFLERFLLEARTAGKLIHPNVVVTHDAATDEETGIPFIAMELVAGETLAERLSRQQRLPWSDALAVTIPIAEALEHAHRSGVVHRDIKPANILLTEDNVPKIADFGIAKVPTAKLTQEGMVIGTPYYMSPEQLRSETLDGRADVFSLGAMLYHLVVGRPPFEGPEAAAILSQVLHKEVAPVSESVPGVPEGLDRVVTHALQKAAARRYRSAAELAEDLRAVQTGQPPQHAPARASQSVAEKTVVSARAASKVPAVSQASVATMVRETLAPVFERLLALPGRSKAACALAPVLLAVILAFVFRDELAREKQLWEATRMAASGDLLASEATLESILDGHPDYARGVAALAEVSRGLVTPELPVVVNARHNHRLGHCTGRLTLGEHSVEYASRKHGTWTFPLEYTLTMNSSSEWHLELETSEEELMGLLDTKRYLFALSKPLDRDVWKRYRRIYAHERTLALGAP